MGMALDEPKDDDRTVTTKVFDFIMAPDVVSVVEQGGGIVIDYVDDGMRKGYTLNLADRLGGECGGGSCGGGDCG
ncbi:MAG: hypothetical protein Q7W29_05920 [bacterium]|nr:hypothetical protein [bacterium]